ncbi:uncharacterized protein [Gossypium hirsutum]|uniref:Aspartic peptidase DDI1-type domain-containing protein n=1 Tax=Gossypium hirsutum TaxID=3635 RepID=A0A1U8NYX1_GOSHI|nr:uncharacterized protein LOC107954121 [Gossypium hirsutum]
MQEGWNLRDIPLPPRKQPIEDLQGEIQQPPQLPMENKTLCDYLMPNLDAIRELLEKMPKYAKFLREVMSRQRIVGRREQIILNKECSAVVSRKVPPKLKDPNSFTIPAEIGGVSFGKALCDLGASINLMPLSIYKRFGLGELKEMEVTLQLADRSLVCPKGFLEDVLVRVRQFIFRIDFIMLEFEEDLEIPILLGRPFLTIYRATIDVGWGELIMDNKGETKVFKCVKPESKFEEASPSQAK